MKQIQKNKIIEHAEAALDRSSATRTVLFWWHLLLKSVTELKNFESRMHNILPHICGPIFNESKKLKTSVINFMASGPIYLRWTVQRPKDAIIVSHCFHNKTLHRLIQFSASSGMKLSESTRLNLRAFLSFVAFMSSPIRILNLISYFKVCRLRKPFSFK